MHCCLSREAAGDKRNQGSRVAAWWPCTHSSCVQGRRGCFSTTVSRACCKWQLPGTVLLLHGSSQSKVSSSKNPLACPESCIALPTLCRQQGWLTAGVSTVLQHGLEVERMTEPTPLKVKYWNGCLLGNLDEGSCLASRLSCLKRNYSSITS